MMFFGKMTNPERLILSNSSNELSVIEDILVHNFSCGPSMISIIDNFGNVYLYNDDEKLSKIKMERSVSHVKFINFNFYALSTDKEFIYEFLLYGKFFKFDNYVMNKYKIDQRFSHKLEIFDTPFYSNIILFTSGIFHIISRIKNL